MLWKMSLKFPRAPSGVKQGNLVMPDYGDVGGSVMICQNTRSNVEFRVKDSSWGVLGIDKLIS